MYISQLHPLLSADFDTSDSSVYSYASNITSLSTINGVKDTGFGTGGDERFGFSTTTDLFDYFNAQEKPLLTKSDYMGTRFDDDFVDFITHVESTNDFSLEQAVKLALDNYTLAKDLSNIVTVTYEKADVGNDRSVKIYKAKFKANRLGINELNKNGLTSVMINDGIDPNDKRSLKVDADGAIESTSIANKKIANDGTEIYRFDDIEENLSDKLQADIGIYIPNHDSPTLTPKEGCTREITDVKLTWVEKVESDDDQPQQPIIHETELAKLITKDDKKAYMFTKEGSLLLSDFRKSIRPMFENDAFGADKDYLDDGNTTSKNEDGLGHSGAKHKVNYVGSDEQSNISFSDRLRTQRLQFGDIANYKLTPMTENEQDVDINTFMIGSYIANGTEGTNAKAEVVDNLDVYGNNTDKDFANAAPYYSLMSTCINPCDQVYDTVLNAGYRLLEAIKEFGDNKLWGGTIPDEINTWFSTNTYIDTLLYSTQDKEFALKHFQNMLTMIGLGSKWREIGNIFALAYAYDSQISGTYFSGTKYHRDTFGKIIYETVTLVGGGDPIDKETMDQSGSYFTNMANNTAIMNDPTTFTKIEDVLHFPKVVYFDAFYDFVSLLHGEKRNTVDDIGSVTLESTPFSMLTYNLFK